METLRLYFQDPYLRTFTGQVLTCEPGKAGYLVTLDQTAFYPEGGGQPCDLGTLGGARVLDVQEDHDVIFHTLDAPLEAGAQVEGRIDWDRRFDHMQQHCGEHILSGILCRDYHCDNVGFHMGADVITIDYNTDITWEQVLDAERQANACIWANVPLEITFPDREALAAIDYRSKKELTGWVRIVTIPGADCCACCGTHPARTGEVGLVKALSCQKFKDGVRIEILCGGRAMKYLSETYDNARAIGQSLSVKPTDARKAVDRLREELAEAKVRMTELEEQVFAATAAAHAGEENVLLVEGPTRPDGVRKLADTLSKVCPGLTAVFAGAQGHYAYALIQAEGSDIRDFVKEMNTALSGRGGGRSGFAQGSVACEEAAIRAFFAQRASSDGVR